MSPSAIVWGSYTLPKPKREGTGQYEVQPVGSLSEGPDGDVYGYEMGFRNVASYNWENLSEAERTTIDTAFKAYAFKPTLLTLLTGTQLTVTAAQKSLVFTVFYDKQHEPHYATSLTWRAASLT